MPDFHVAFRDLLHAVNLRHGTDGFTFPPKEGVLWIFSPWKIRRLRPGLNPRTWVPKASTLRLDQRSRWTRFLESVRWELLSKKKKKKYIPMKLRMVLIVYTKLFLMNSISRLLSWWGYLLCTDNERKQKQSEISAQV
jgi:hypothetical protein